MTDIEELREVIRNFHRAKATHIESVPVKDSLRGQTVWDGIVEVFRIEGHPMANRVYAWTEATGDPENPKHHETILHIPPVTSPNAAVRKVVTRELKYRAGS
jgi:hypothetical protein